MKTWLIHLDRKKVEEFKTLLEDQTLSKVEEYKTLLLVAEQIHSKVEECKTPHLVEGQILLKVAECKTRLPQETHSKVVECKILQEDLIPWQSTGNTIRTSTMSSPRKQLLLPSSRTKETN